MATHRKCEDKECEHYVGIGRCNSSNWSPDGYYSINDNSRVECPTPRYRKPQFVSMGERKKYAFYILGFYNQLSDMIEDTVEVPADPKQKRKFIKNFIKQAVKDKLAHLSQKENNEDQTP